MFRIDTVVRLLGVLILLSSQIAFATETAASGSRNCDAEVQAITDAEKALDEAVAAGADAARIKVLTDRLAEKKQRYASSCGGSGTGAPANCEEAKGKYGTSKGALASACLTLGGGNSGQTGWPLCTLAISQCDQCPAEGPNPNPNVPCNDVTTGDEEGESSRTNDTAIGLRSIATGKQLLNYCPGKLGAEQKELEKQMQESQKEVRRLEGELPKLQTEYTELVAATESQVSEIQDQMTEAQNQYDEQLEAASNAQDEAVKALQEKIVGIEEQIARADDNVRQLQLEKTDAENKYTETIKGLDLQCHATAVNTTAKYQQDRLALERNKQFNRVSFNAMLKNVGVSDRESWQRVAEKYYQWCLQSKPTKDQKDSARKAYDAQITRLNEAAAKIERDKVRLREAIKRVQNDQGCNANQGPQNPQGGETDICRAMRMAKQQAERLTRQYNNKMNTLNRKVAEAQRSGAAKAQAKLAEAELIQKQLAEERLRLQNLKQYLELAYQAGGGGTAADAKSYTDAKSKYGEFVAAASVFVGACTQATCLADTACIEADAFLKNIQAHPGFSNEMAASDTLEPLVEPETARGGAADCRDRTTGIVDATCAAEAAGASGR